jgi:hypothetical protein
LDNKSLHGEMPRESGCTGCVSSVWEEDAAANGFGVRKNAGCEIILQWAFCQQFGFLGMAQ